MSTLFLSCYFTWSTYTRNSPLTIIERPCYSVTPIILLYFCNFVCAGFPETHLFNATYQFDDVDAHDDVTEVVLLPNNNRNNNPDSLSHREEARKNRWGNQYFSFRDHLMVPWSHWFVLVTFSVIQQSISSHRTDIFKNIALWLLHVSIQTTWCCWAWNSGKKRGGWEMGNSSSFLLSIKIRKLLKVHVWWLPNVPYSLVCPHLDRLYF